MDLRIEHLSKTYPNGVHALRDVTLTIPRGMFGLLGPNGAGKSSLMRTLATLQEPDAGSVMLGDIDVLREKDRVRRTLGYLPQEFGVYPSVSAERLLDHFAVLEGFTDRGARRRVVEALLRQTNLWDVRRERLGGYSGGMRQRFGIAVALLGDPSLIIVDEPTAGLDPPSACASSTCSARSASRRRDPLHAHRGGRRGAVPAHGDHRPREILLEAEPLAAIAALRGRVWKRVVSKQELPADRAGPPPDLHEAPGRAHRRARPRRRAAGPEFEPVEPDLEDVYFSVMAGHHGARAGQGRPRPQRRCRRMTPDASSRDRARARSARCSASSWSTGCGSRPPGSTRSCSSGCRSC
jgi:ABC-type lipoprotein export system ATPase subunit